MSALLNRAAILAAGGISLATMANAQEAAPDSPRAPVAPIEQAGSLPNERVQVEAGTGDGSASISLELLSRAADPIATREEGVVRNSTDTLGLVLSTPWNGDDDAAPATLDGLANGTKLTFRWGRYSSFLRRLRTPQMRSLELAAREECRKAARDSHRVQTEALRNALVDNTSADPDPRTRRTQILASELERNLDQCQFPPGGFGNLVNQHLADRSLEYIQMFRPRGSYEYGIEASIGRNGFTFVDPATLVESEDTKVQWGARAYYTRYLLHSPTAFTITAAYQRAYKAADDAVFCPANPGNIVIQCTTAAAGPPALNESLLISAGLRHRFASSGLFANMAVAPLVTYDVLNDVVGVDVPVYFIPDGDGGLTGGVRFGYRSDQEDKFSVGVFIGAAFNILQ